MDYISQNKTLLVGTNTKNILKINIEKFLDPNISFISMNDEHNKSEYS